MKTIHNPRMVLLLMGLASATLSGCESVIDASVPPGPTQLAVEAWLTDQPGEQHIKLTQTTGYFTNTGAKPATGANVVVTDNAGRAFVFTDPDSDGIYRWKPASSSDTTGRLGIIGRTYTLSIRYQNSGYVSVAQMPRIPTVDGLHFTIERTSGLGGGDETGYQSEFSATDLPGETDYYYLRYYRNGVLQNRPQDINLSRDGAFLESDNTDGLPFTKEVRQSLNPDKLFVLGDTMRVEMRSLTPEGYLFWQSLLAQTQNAGLFATPPANVPSNIRNVSGSEPVAVGFFLVSPVRTATAVVNVQTIRAD